MQSPTPPKNVAYAAFSSPGKKEAGSSPSTTTTHLPSPPLEPPILIQRASRISSHQQLLPPIAIAPRDSVAGNATTAPSFRGRVSSFASNKSAGVPDDTTGKMKINMGKERSLGTDVKYRPDFKFNMELALRTAVGVVLASLVMTKASGNSNNALISSNSHRKQWYFFPEWYILGGLSYVATATVFGCGKNIGSTIRELYQQISGVGMALLYNLLIFSYFEPQVFNTKADLIVATTDGTLTHITRAFSGNPYWVHQRDFFTILPFIMLFTLMTLVLPLETNTKKYMLGNNLYFALTLVSPNDFTNPAVLKTPGDDFYKTNNILRNLVVYMMLGVTGACIAQLMLWFPYPIFAIRKLQEKTTGCAESIQEALNLIVDSYCFKNKDVEHMNFLKLKLKRKFDVAIAKHAEMTALLNDVWWEQLVGLHIPLKFRLSAVKPFIDLYGSQIENLRAMNQAIVLERYESLHELFMKSIQKEVYVVQLHATKLLDEISLNVHNGTTAMDLDGMAKLEKSMEGLLTHFQQTQNRVYKKHKPTASQVEANIPLNLFLFSLQSYCATLLEFQEKFNGKTHHTGRRVFKFLKTTLSTFVDKGKYPMDKLQMAFKVWIAILVACFFSVYTFGYSSTTAGAVAYVMGNHIGGSFSVTANRVGGVIAGSIIPSICLFYICSYACTSSLVVAITSYTILFVWVTFSMYIKWKGGFEAYAGLISAFTATQVLLKGCDGCQTGTVAPISSYSNLAQMSLGIVLFIIVEMMICPQSAMALLRLNVQKQLKYYQQCFQVLVEDTLAHDGLVVDGDTTAADEIKDIVQKKLPALLVEQAALLKEAAFEPLLWKPPFSTQKYEAVLDCCQRLLNNTLVLYKLTQWYKTRMEAKKEPAVVVDDETKDTTTVATVEAQPPVEPWGFSTVEVGRAINDTFDTLHHLFGDNFTYADGDQTALFMQMKEAFRLADTDCSGEIDADEVKCMIQMIFAQSGAVKVDAIDTYVAEFMRVVDKDESGKVSLEEFIDALEHGLQLQVQVFQHRSKKVAALMPTIGEEGSRNSTETDADAVRRKRQSRQSQQRTSDQQTQPLVPQRLSSQMQDEDAMTRAHDMLNVDSFSLPEIAQAMRTTYATWLMDQKRYEKSSMEELLLLNCLISGVSGFARNLAHLEEMTVQQ
ncbi:Aste57867_9717 [Aphanomyces stellatus]|uniref:Aste57867_9717 protein n=1 Tax=Aphanomyces stellatus TaxID=120398 RepID=A0A485KNL1_9STRA|nr:hypothetical protein As57867_009679 [Aphanomyces stellatus]VFT86596.1 Aste57867_9717 [Aphanomyces stellatus]